MRLYALALFVTLKAASPQQENAGCGTWARGLRSHRRNRRLCL